MKEPRIRPEMRKYWDSLTPEQKERELRKTRSFNVIKIAVIIFILLMIFQFSKEATRLKDERDANEHQAYYENLAREEQRLKELEEKYSKTIIPLDNPNGPVGSEPRDESRDYSIDLGDGVMLEMVWIPPGYFNMGGRGQWDETPIHLVQLDGFWIGRYEVTNAQFRKFKPDHHVLAYYENDLDGDDQPACRLPHREGKVFWDWLSEKTGDHYALPTEAQWEYACRAGTAERNYWGDGGSICDYANVADQSLTDGFPEWKFKPQVGCSDGWPASAPVGSFPPNPWGLYDMIGNVSEMCADFYLEDFYRYKYASAKNPQGPLPEMTEGYSRVLRGGSWGGEAGDWRCAARDRHSDVVDWEVYIGFRVVRNVEPLTAASNSEMEAED